MNLYNDASLAMIPSAVKDGKLYSIRPTDGSGDFTFSRGSNLAATRVDVNGLIEKGRENLLLQSNQFDTTWGTQNASVTSGQSGYDGSSDAWLLTSTSTTNARVEQSNTNSGVQTFSVYAKAGSANFIRVMAQVTGSGIVWYSFFDLANGTIETNAFLIDKKIESVGATGWYRCSITYNSTNVKLVINACDADGSTAVTSGNSIYIQDAQLEVGLVATDYIETTTTTAVSGITEDLPRLHYSGGASCPSLLLEPTRTNLIPHSEYFGNGSGWTNQNINYPLTNVSTSVDGLNNASLLSGGTTSGVAFRYIFRLITSNTTNTFSFFAKKKTGSGNIWLLGKNNNTFAYYNLTNGTADSATSGMTIDIEDYGDGWYRCYFTQDYTSASAYSIGIGVCVESGIANYDASINPLQEVYIYGGQFESGSHPSSYIPTYGSAVTRSSDSCFLQNTDVYSSGSGTIFFEVGDYNTNSSANGFNKILVFNEVATSSIANIIYFEEYDGDNTVLIRKGGSTILQSTPSYQDLRNSKIAVKWNSEEAKIFINGVLNITYIGDVSLDIQYFGFDIPYNGEIVSTIKIKQLVGFPTALTDSECIALTTL